MGGVFWKFTSPGRAGVPDRLAVFPDGRVVFVELKTETGRLTKLQKAVQKQLIDLWQQVCTVYGMDGAREFLEDVKNNCFILPVYAGDDIYDQVFDREEVMPK